MRRSPPELAKTFRYGAFQLYLQFDGVQGAGQHLLARRGLARHPRTGLRAAAK